MSKQPHSASGLPMKALKVTSPKPPPHADEHDEWLLDETLTETFPASDAIAISLYRRSQPRRTSPPVRAGEIGVTDRIADCIIGHGKDPRHTTLETPIECDHCHTEIPTTVALSFEGADYIYHFCGPQCFEAWSKMAIAHDK